MGRKKAEDNAEEIVEEQEEVETTEQEDATEDTRCKRDIIADTIDAGGATMESLMEAAGCKYASVMSNFSMLRLTGRCPVKDVPVTVENEDGEEVEVMTYRLVDTDEWEAIKAQKAEQAKTKKAPARSPEEQLAMLEKRAEKAEKAKDAAADRLSNNEDSRILECRAEIASLQFEVATIELDEQNAKMAE